MYKIDYHKSCWPSLKTTCTMLQLTLKPAVKPLCSYRLIYQSSVNLSQGCVSKSSAGLGITSLRHKGKLVGSGFTSLFKSKGSSHVINSYSGISQNGYCFKNVVHQVSNYFFLHKYSVHCQLMKIKAVKFSELCPTSCWSLCSWLDHFMNFMHTGTTCNKNQVSKIF